MIRGLLESDCADLLLVEVPYTHNERVCQRVCEGVLWCVLWCVCERGCVRGCVVGGVCLPCPTCLLKSHMRTVQSRDEDANTRRGSQNDRQET